MNEQDKQLVQKMIDEAIFKSNQLRTKKRGDTPTDNYHLTPQQYVNLNGSVAARPINSVATIGQKYFATDTKILMIFDGLKWYNGAGSVVASN